MPDDQSELVRSRYDRGTAIAAVAIAGSWHLLHNLLAMLATWSEYAWPALAGTAWLVYAAGVVVAGRACVTGRAIRRPWLGCAVTLLVTVVVGVTAADPLTPANWGWGAAGWLAIMLLWRRPLTDLLLFLGLNAAASLGVLLVAGAGDRVSLGRYLVVIGGTVTLQLGLAGGTRALRAAAGWAAAAAAAQAETVAAGLAAEEAHRARLERYGAFQRATTTLLAGLADGTADPADPAIRHACAIQAARLRRLLVERGDTPDPLLDELRACGDIAERKGVVVELSIVGRIPPLPVQVRRALAEPAIEVLAAAGSRARVTVSALPDEISVSVVADVGAADVGAADPGTADVGAADPGTAARAPAGAECGTDPATGVVVDWHRTSDQIWVDARVPRPRGAGAEPLARTD